MFCCGSLGWLRQYGDRGWREQSTTSSSDGLHYKKWCLLIFKSKMPTKCANWAVILAVTSGKDWSKKTNNLLSGDLWRKATCPPEALPSLDNYIWRIAREDLVSRRLHGQARSPGPRALFGPTELPSVSFFPSVAICLPLPSHLPPTHQLWQAPLSFQNCFRRHATAPVPSRTLWDSWAQKPFCIPPFLDYRKQVSFSLYDGASLVAQR